jgi:hypothetical protein
MKYNTLQQIPAITEGIALDASKLVNESYKCKKVYL